MAPEGSINFILLAGQEDVPLFGGKAFNGPEFGFVKLFLQFAGPGFNDIHQQMLEVLSFERPGTALGAGTPPGSAIVSNSQKLG